MIVPWGRERKALGLRDVDGPFMTGTLRDKERKEAHARRVINGSLLKNTESQSSLLSETLVMGDYAAQTVVAGGDAMAVDSHDHRKLLDYYAGGDYSQITSLPRRTPCEAVSARPSVVEFLDLIVEGCATQWRDMRSAFKKFDNRNKGVINADDLGIVFRRAFNVHISPEEADELVSMFGAADGQPHAIHVTYSQFCSVVEREMQRGYKPRRSRA